jgi:cell division protein FtsQ
MRWLSRKSPPAGNGKGKRAAPRRQRPAPRWARPALRAAGVVAFIAIAVGGPTWLWKAGAMDRAWQAAWAQAMRASAGAGLVVRQVTAEGRVETDRGALLRALGVRIGEPILALDPEAARRRIEKLPWVRSASVERRLPDTIRVRVLERHAMAWWQRDHRLVLIDRTGAPIPVGAPSRYRDLIVLVGPDAPRHAASLLALLRREPGLAGRVRAAVRVGGRRWNVRLAGEIDVRLPEDDAAAAWSRLADAERRHKILSRDIVAVDLRLPDRLIVETKGGPSSDKGPRGRQT